MTVPWFSGPGVELIAAERERQITHEQWSPEHDDRHRNGQLANAAAVYALTVPVRGKTILGRSLVEILWPWDRRWWKPTDLDRVRELVKAGALIAAEIDRLSRAANSQGIPNRE